MEAAAMSQGWRTLALPQRKLLASRLRRYTGSPENIGEIMSLH
jgi:hypothetical protein